MKLILLGFQKHCLPVSIVSSYISVWLLRSIKIVEMHSIILINNCRNFCGRLEIDIAIKIL